MAELSELLDVLHLEPGDGGVLTGQNLKVGGGSVVFGGQLLAQSLIAGASIDDTKHVKSLHTIFARGAALDVPLTYDVETLQQGRAFASASVTARQGDRLCTRSSVLLSAEEPDLIRHQADAPSAGTPAEATPGGHGPDYWEIRSVGGVDIADPDEVGPPELGVWTRFRGDPLDVTTSQALLAFASDGFLIGTAMRPHPGAGQKLAHITISTSVIAHTMSFHEPFDATEWMLLQHESPYAGRGRSHGRAQVFTEDGRLVASFTQENMIRDYPAGQAPAPGRRAAH